MAKDDLKSIEDVTSASENLGFAVDAFLRGRGWKSTCSNPASLWLWEKKLVDGRTVLVNRDTALLFIQLAGDES